MAQSNSIVPRVLVIAGSDSSGGAGMQRDLGVLANQAVGIACVVTAVTAQSNRAVQSIHYVPTASIAEQLACALEEPIAAIKIGMLGTKECVHTISKALKTIASTQAVLDPVLVSSSGRPLLEADATDALLHELCPLATVVTPNLAEAAQLLSSSLATSDAECAAQAHALSARLQTAVLLKGGHASGHEAVDLLAQVGRPLIALRTERISATMRGTGCALSSLIAAQLAHGSNLEDACRRSKDGVTALLRQQLW